MTRFASQFARTGGVNLIYQFGESVTYVPDSGAERTIQAIVERETQVIDNGIPALATVVRVRNDSTLGISATEIDTGTDQLKVSLRVGEAAQTRQIVRVVSTDNGFVRFMVN